MHDDPRATAVVVGPRAEARPGPRAPGPGRRGENAEHPRGPAGARGHPGLRQVLQGVRVSPAARDGRRAAARHGASLRVPVVAALLCHPHEHNARLLLVHDGEDVTCIVSITLLDGGDD